MVQPVPRSSGQANYNKYRDKFNRCKYNTTKEEPPDDSSQKESDPILQLLHSTSIKSSPGGPGEELLGAARASCSGGGLVALDNADTGQQQQHHLAGQSALQVLHNNSQQHQQHPHQMMHQWPDWHSNTQPHHQHQLGHHHLHQPQLNRDQGRLQPSRNELPPPPQGRPTSGSRSRHNSAKSESTRISKDEKMAREAGITFSIDQIVGLPMDEFNDLLSRHDLTEEQLNLCRDIRRRGKNKVAAQNCRKRKIDQIEELQQRLNDATLVTDKMKKTHQRKLEEYAVESQRLTSMLHQTLISNRLDPNTNTIEIVNGEVVFRKKHESESHTILPKPADNFRLSFPYEDLFFPSSDGFSY